MITLIVILLCIRWLLDGAGYKRGKNYRIDSKGQRRFK